MSSNPVATSQSKTSPVHTINLREEEQGLMAPVNVVTVKSSSNVNGSKAGGVKGTFQSLKAYVAKLWTQFLTLSFIDKSIFVGFVILIVIGIILTIVLNTTLRRSIGTPSTCNLTYSWNGTGTTFVSDTSLDSPQAVYIKNSIVYISDASATPTIYSIPTTGGTLTATITSTTMASPQSIYIDQSNHVFVPDYDNGCVFKFTTFGALVTPTVVAGDNGNPGSDLNQLDGPTHLAFDSAETYMFIADSNNDRIMRYLTTATSGDDGVVVASGADNGVDQPFGIYYDSSSDYLYIGSGRSNIVIKWKPFASSGTIVIGTAGVAGSSTSLLYGTGAIFHDATAKQLYVVDAGNARVMAYCDNDSSGTIIAGTGTPGSGSKQLASPYEMAFDSNWNLYVLDADNNRLQKYSRL